MGVGRRRRAGDRGKACAFAEERRALQLHPDDLPHLVGLGDGVQPGHANAPGVGRPQPLDHLQTRAHLVERDEFVGLVRLFDRAGAADGPPGEVCQPGRIASEGDRPARYSFHFAEIGHRIVSAQRVHHCTFRTYSFQGLQDPGIAGEGGPEIEAERDFRTQDVLRIVAAEHAYIPGRRSKYGILRKVHGVEQIHEIYKFRDRAYAMFRIAGMARCSMDGDRERFGSFGSGDQTVIGRFSHQYEIPARTIPGPGFRPKGTGLFSGQQQKSEIPEIQGFQLAAGRVHREDLPLGIAASAPQDHLVVSFRQGAVRKNAPRMDIKHSRRDVGRDGVQMRAENEGGFSRPRPVEEKVPGAVSHFKGQDLTGGFLRVAFHGTRQPLRQELRQFPFLSGSRGNVQYVQKQTQIHHATTINRIFGQI